MIVNQKVKMKDTKEYGYICLPIEVEIIWEDRKKGTALLNELEFIGGRFEYKVLEEDKLQ